MSFISLHLKEIVVALPKRIYINVSRIMGSTVCNTVPNILHIEYELQIEVKIDVSIHRNFTYHNSISFQNLKFNITIISMNQNNYTFLTPCCPFYIKWQPRISIHDIHVQLFK
ncbi:hypothetical protein RF11_13060 [Thelohanellus kitauei]|uniref:Uncharacterized protein n=1 Tax=Thelohanellus kitauei TaxID=669202 RepID=A0A0C2IWW2_THEKT|nr:hypothetical protein RF11_13060 [Thelohanellus kitauei]